ncbi:MAG: hypothetical protein JWR81_5406 [Pseudonocardia sp.]|nr:hypothetical protein [Pseudonocardia sp.]
MHRYYADYFDLYWDLHLGVTGEAIPAEVRQIGASFTNVLGYWYPTADIVHENIMRVRELRPLLKDWLDSRVQALIDGDVRDPEGTLVYYWLKNGGGGEHFRRKDIVFECFHNFLAFSQWGNTVYHTMAVLDAGHGDPGARSWFARTMAEGPDEADGHAFTPLDRFVMELFRTISPNGGSLSTVGAQRGLEPRVGNIITPTWRRARTPGTGSTRRSSIRTATSRRRRAPTTTRRNARRRALPVPPSQPDRSRSTMVARQR